MSSNPQRLPSQRLLDAEMPVATQLGARRTILPWLLVAVLSAAVGGLVTDRMQHAGDGDARTDAPVSDSGARTTTVAAGRRALEATTDQQGNLVLRGVAEPVWPMPITVAARADGVVAKLHVHPGERVTPGRSPLITLENQPLQLKLDEATARLQLARTHLASLQDEARGPELARLEDAVRIAEQRRNDLSDRYEAARVVSPDAVSPEDLRRIKTELDLAEQRVDDARAAVDDLTERTLRDRRVAQEQLAAVTAEHTRLVLAVEALTVLAPEAPGANELMVLTLPVGHGQWVKTTQTICTLYDPSQMQIRVVLPSRDLRKVELARVTISNAPTVPRNPDDEFGEPAPAPGTSPAPPSGETVPGDAIDGTDPGTGSSDGSQPPPPIDPDDAGDMDDDQGPAPAPGRVQFRGGTECEIRPLAGSADDEMRGWPIAVLPQADPELDAVTVLIRVETPSPSLRPGTPVRVRMRMVGR